MAVLPLLAVAMPLEAQEPPDTAQQAGQQQDTTTVGQVEPDSVSADTIFYNLPRFPERAPPGFATGIWVWDRDAIMASGANTLAELVAEVPGLIAVWGGDYGSPTAMSAFGLGGGGYRIYRDGFEIFPVDGGVADLQRIGLVGIEEVRLDRSAGAMVVDLRSHQHDDGRPFSVIEAGTGDLDTNLFRGVYADPTALGGSIAVGLERVDTRGVGTDEGGNRTGTWVRYQLHLRDRAGLALEYRKGSSQTQVDAYAPRLARSDLVVRGRAEPVDGVVLEAYTGRSTFDADEAGDAYTLYGGTRAQHGFRLGLERAGVWADGSMRLYEGDLPTRALEVAGGASTPWGGLDGGYRNGAWGGETTSSVRGRGWLGPVAGLTLFGSWESGTFGARDAPVLDGLTIPMPPFLPRPTDDPPALLVTDRTALRLGGSVSWFGASLAGAFLSVDSDQDLPLGTEIDLGSIPQPGMRRRGIEGWGSIPVPIWEGLSLEGSYQRWEHTGPYLPRQVYRGSLEYHQVHLESGNLELWWSLGVRGHDPMDVYVAATEDAGVPGLTTLRFYQDWYARIQVRIVTVRLFLGWDNFTLRRSLQTVPDRPLPYLRSFFGLRWDMWN